MKKRNDLCLKFIQVELPEHTNWEALIWRIQTWFAVYLPESKKILIAFDEILSKLC